MHTASLERAPSFTAREAAGAREPNERGGVAKGLEEEREKRRKRAGRCVRRAPASFAELSLELCGQEL